MRTVTVRRHLPIDCDRLWAEIKKPRLLLHLARPLLVIRPMDPPDFPDVWEEMDYVATLSFVGILPLGRQVISISWPVAGDETRSVRDNGYGRIARRWDHTITITPGKTGAVYEDKVSIEAGLATPLVAAFAWLFYRHRQQRLASLIRRGFVY